VPAARRGEEGFDEAQGTVEDGMDRLSHVGNSFALKGYRLLATAPGVHDRRGASACGGVFVKKIRASREGMATIPESNI
jgi:hypothetical protein